MGRARPRGQPGLPAHESPLRVPGLPGHALRHGGPDPAWADLRRGDRGPECGYIQSGCLGSTLEPTMRAPSPEQLSVYGALHLAAATAAAACYDRAATETALAKARNIADRTGEVNQMGTAFGPVNVAIHAISASLRLGDPRTATETGEALDTYVASLIALNDHERPITHPGHVAAWCPVDGLVLVLACVSRDRAMASVRVARPRRHREQQRRESARRAPRPPPRWRPRSRRSLPRAARTA
jgi:hypothetical protein